MAELTETLGGFQKIEKEVAASFSGHKSAWTFKTSGTANLGLGYVVLGGGDIQFRDPAGKVHKMDYAGAGGGLSFGIPKILSSLARMGKFLRLARVLQSIDPKDVAGRRSAGEAPESFPNHGMVFVLGGCPAPDLSEPDLKGMCLYLDIGASLYYGYSGEVMLMNCNPGAFMALANDYGPAGELAFLTTLRPHAMLLSCGPSKGLQANAGASVSVGIMTPDA